MWTHNCYMTMYRLITINIVGPRALLAVFIMTLPSMKRMITHLQSLVAQIVMVTCRLMTLCLQMMFLLWMIVTFLMTLPLMQIVMVKCRLMTLCLQMIFLLWKIQRLVCGARVESDNHLRSNLHNGLKGGGTLPEEDEKGTETRALVIIYITEVSAPGIFELFQRSSSEGWE